MGDAAPRWHVVLPDSAPDTIRMLEETGGLQRLRALGRLTVHEDRPSSPAAFGERVADADAVLLAWDFPSAAFEAASRLKTIVFAGAGAASFVDLDLAARHGVEVLTARGYGDASVAEHALALALAGLRRVGPGDALIRGGGWTPDRDGRDLSGCHVGLLGWGGIARALARLLTGFDVEISAWSRSREPGAREGDVTFRPLDEVVSTADVLSLHLPLTEETKGLVSAARLRSMKDGAFLVNTARGGLLDEGALCELLTSGHLAGAALDVFGEEPLPEDSPLRHAPNLLMTPHVAYRTGGARRRLYGMTVDNLVAAHARRGG